jgi:phosphopantothenoylcysteine decarboxylase/phosphopantothenate--cysteine ligase
MGKSVLIIVTGSIAAYKTLDVIRRLREHNVQVTTVLTKGGAEFVTPLSLASVSGSPVYSELFSLKDETEMGHIRLSRENDLIAVLPASADIIAKMASGLTDDLATATLLATDKPVIIAPAMNSKMWEHPATKRNIAQLRKDGISIIEPDSGSLACGEVGAGRLAEVDTIVSTLLARLEGNKPLSGFSVLVTSGPTYEAIDPVRFIGNRSSGKQGNAIAQALSDAGAKVTLVTGPVSEPLPHVANIIRVESAEEMLAACKTSLPVDIAVFCAAVADWRVKSPFGQKLKKRSNESTPHLNLVLNPDILHTISTLKTNRPKLVIGFAAETENLKKNAQVKLKSKGCNWIVAVNVSEGDVFGKDKTNGLFIANKVTEEWKNLTKQALAGKLIEKITEYFDGKEIAVSRPPSLVAEGVRLIAKASRPKRDQFKKGHV